MMASAKGQGTRRGPFEVGFSEDENLKWRKSMEVILLSCFLKSDFLTVKTTGYSRNSRTIYGKYKFWFFCYLRWTWR